MIFVFIFPPQARNTRLVNMIFIIMINIPMIIISLTNRRPGEDISALNASSIVTSIAMDKLFPKPAQHFSRCCGHNGAQGCYGDLSSAAFRPEWKKLFVYLKHCLNSFHVLLTKNIVMDMLKYLPCAVFLLPRKENDDDTYVCLRN